jgi:hypothetical protein
MAILASMILLIGWEKGYTDSPSFARQQIIDFALDWYKKNNTQDYFSNPAAAEYLLLHLALHIQNTSDISSITTSSNGKILNVTFWLTGPFNEKPTKSIPQYYIRFDADSRLSTGDKFGADYLFAVTWNNDTKSWDQIFQEYSPAGKHFRVIQSSRNYSNFFSNFDSSLISEKVNKTDYLTCCYVSFPIELQMMNYPKTYSMSFHIIDKIGIKPSISLIFKDKHNKTLGSLNGPYEYLDSSADMSVPIPTYEVAAESQIINLTQNIKSAPIIINSVSESPARIGLSVSNESFPSKFVSIVPNTPKDIQPHGKSNFDLVYSGYIKSTSSFVIPINLSIYPRIDNADPNKIVYADTPSGFIMSSIVWRRIKSLNFTG